MKLVPYYTISTPLPKTQPMRDRSLFVIIIGVCLLHILTIVLSFTPLTSPQKKTSRQKVVVKTIKLNPQLEPLAPMTEAAVFAPPLLIVQAEKPPIPAPELIKESPQEVKIEKSVENIPVVQTPSPDPQPIPEPQKKVEAPKVEPKNESKAQPKTTLPPKTIPKEPKKPAAKKPAPVKKAVSEQPKQVKPPKPTPEEIAAQEAEKQRQRELLAMQEAARARQQELLAKAKESVAKIGETRDKISANKLVNLESTTIPKQLESLRIDALPTGTTVPVELSTKEISYRDEITYRLKLALKLPDYGAVNIKLALDRSGKVVSVQIVNSESNKNKQYIEKTVPSLIFPAFGNNFTNASTYTFLINLNNEN